VIRPLDAEASCRSARAGSLKDTVALLTRALDRDEVESHHSLFSGPLRRWARKAQTRGYDPPGVRGEEHRPIVTDLRPVAIPRAGAIVGRLQDETDRWQRGRSPYDWCFLATRRLLRDAGPNGSLWMVPLLNRRS
jgi:hypothetical protein